MRIHEILTESQLAQLDEGPIGSALGAVGRGVGKAVGGVAKGVGAVAGGVRGAFTALKKGYQTGKAVVGDDPDPNAGRPGYTYTPPADQAEPAAPAAAPAAAAPAAAPSLTTPPSAAEINAQGPKGSAPAKQQTGDAGKALARTTAVVDKTQAQNQEKANQTVYAQVKANVDKLDKKGKQRILQMLQKSMSAPAPAAAPAKPGAAPAAGAGAFGQMAQQLAKGGAAQQPNTMANAPVSATNTAKPGNPNLAQPAAAEPAAGAPAAAPAGQGAFANVAGQLAKPAGRPQGGGKVAGAPPSTTPGAIKKRATRAAAKQPAAVTASLVHHGLSLNEVLAQRLDVHKRRMFESSLANGTTSVFVK